MDRVSWLNVLAFTAICFRSSLDMIVFKVLTLGISLTIAVLPEICLLGGWNDGLVLRIMVVCCWGMGEYRIDLMDFLLSKIPGIVDFRSGYFIVVIIVIINRQKQWFALFWLDW